jgi:hypothetical protein
VAGDGKILRKGMCRGCWVLLQLKAVHRSAGEGQGGRGQRARQPALTWLPAFLKSFRDTTPTSCRRGRPEQSGSVQCKAGQDRGQGRAGQGRRRHESQSQRSQAAAAGQRRLRPAWHVARQHPPCPDHPPLPVAPTPAPTQLALVIHHWQ